MILSQHNNCDGSSSFLANDHMKNNAPHIDNNNNNEWHCPACTYVNSNALFLTCEMCGEARPDNKCTGMSGTTASESLSSSEEHLASSIETDQAAWVNDHLDEIICAQHQIFDSIEREQILQQSPPTNIQQQRAPVVPERSSPEGDDDDMDAVIREQRELLDAFRRENDRNHYTQQQQQQELPFEVVLTQVEAPPRQEAQQQQQPPQPPRRQQPPRRRQQQYDFELPQQRVVDPVMHDRWINVDNDDASIVSEITMPEDLVPVATACVVAAPDNVRAQPVQRSRSGSGKSKTRRRSRIFGRLLH